jgi:transaldolase
MNLFVDTSSAADIQRLIETGLVDGVTTNPTSLSKEGGNPRDVVTRICTLLGDRDVSIEVTEQDPEALYKQAHTIAALAKNVVVKIPCHPRYVSIIRRLSEEGIPLNITLVFTVMQGLMMAKLGVRYISPFIGRLDEIEQDGVEVIEELRKIFDRYDVETMILAASVRSAGSARKAFLAGADVVTMAPHIFEECLRHPLSDQGIEKFRSDWNKGGGKGF